MISQVHQKRQTLRISHLDGRDTLRLYVETNGSVLPRSEKKTKRVLDERYE